MGSETLRFVIKAKDEASGALRGVGGGFGKLGALAKVGIAMALASLVALGAAILHFGGQFEEAFNTIRIGTGATGAALGVLKEDFKAVVKNVPTDFASASTAIADLNTRLGLTGKPLRALASDFLKLHKILDVDVKTSIAETTRLFGDWSIKGIGKQREALNLLFRTTQQTGIGWDSLTQTVVQFGAPLRNMGFTFAESIAMLGKWEKEGVNVSTTLTGMRFALKTFAAEGIDPKKGIAKTIEQIKELPKLKALDLGKKVFGLRAFSDVVAAIREGRFEYEDLIASVANGSDTIAKAERDTRTWKDNLTLLKNNALVALEPVLSRVTGKLAEWSGELVKAGKSGAAKEAFGKVAAAVKKVNDVWQKVMPIFAPWIAVAKLIIENWSTVGPFLARAFETIKEAASAAWSYIAETFGPAMAEVTQTVRHYLDKLAGFWEKHGATIKAAFRAMWRAGLAVTREILPMIVGVVKGVLNILAGIIRAIAAVMRGDWSAAWNGIKQIAKGASMAVQAIVRGLGRLVVMLLKAAWSLMVSGARTSFNMLVSAVRSGASKAVSFVRSLPGKIVSAIGNLGSLLYSAGAALIQGLVNGITSRLQALWSTVSNMASRIKSTVTGALGIDSPSKVFRGYGVNIMEGLALGLGDGIAPVTSQLASVTRQMTVAPALQLGAFGGAPAAASAGGNIVFENCEFNGAPPEAWLEKAYRYGKSAGARDTRVRTRTLGLGR